MTQTFRCAGLFLAATIPAAAMGNAWHVTAASNVRAARAPSGLSISADVQLADPCYEARIIVYPKKTPRAEYQVVTRIKPADAGKMCAMVIVPSEARGYFRMDRVPKTVTVHALNRTFTVRVGASP